MLELNGKELTSWYDVKNVTTFKLAPFALHDAWDWAKGLEGQDLVVSQDGDERKRYGGYTVTDCGVEDDGTVVMRAQRALDPDTAAAIEALESNVSTATADAAGAAQTANAAMTIHDEAIGELGVSTAALLESNSQLTASNADVLQAIGELGAMVAAMQVSPDTPSHESGETA